VQVIYQHKTSFDQIREIVAAKKEQIDQKLGPALNKIHEETKKDGYEDPVYLVWGVACLSAAVILMIISEGKTLLISAALVGAALITLYKYSKHPNDR
jgi:Flp pilus assembly protein TadB